MLMRSEGQKGMLLIGSDQGETCGAVVHSQGLICTYFLLLMDDRVAN